MDVGLGPCVCVLFAIKCTVLILVLVDVGLGHAATEAEDLATEGVLILVLVDVGLGRRVEIYPRSRMRVLILVLVDVGLGLLHDTSFDHTVFQS